MLREGFILAMTADICLCDYAKPDLVVARKAEWLLVSRWGDDGKYLCISMAGPRTATDKRAPPTIKPTFSLLGVLFASSPKRQRSEFLIVRDAAPSVHLTGGFSPADGYARLEGSTRALRLEAVARYAHDCRVEDGQAVRRYASQIETASEAMTWRIDARQTEWVGNFVSE